MFCVRGTEKEWRHFGTPSKPGINAVHRGNVAALLMVEPTNRRAIVVDRDGIEIEGHKLLLSISFVNAVS